MFVNIYIAMLVHGQSIKLCLWRIISVYYHVSNDLIFPFVIRDIKIVLDIIKQGSLFLIKTRFDSGFNLDS